MPGKIFVPLLSGYSKALEGLGEFSNDAQEFMKFPKKFKLILFTGGEDVSPEYYNDTSPIGFCHSNRKRDDWEAIIFKQALKNDIKMTGICRGCQFINVMSGGSMMHHINSHAGSIHELECLKDDEIRLVNSLHHQMIIPPHPDNVIAWSSERLSDIYIGLHDEKVEWDRPETEAIYIPETKCCGVQWHPEIMQVKSDGFQFYHQMIADFLEMDEGEFRNAYTGDKGLREKREKKKGASGR